LLISRIPSRCSSTVGLLFFECILLPLLIRRYGTAIEYCRNNDDWVWLASALEGHVSATLLLPQWLNNHLTHHQRHLHSSSMLEPQPDFNWNHNFSDSISLPFSSFLPTTVATLPAVRTALYSDSSENQEDTAMPV
jgi:hypothetical protein